MRFAVALPWWGYLFILVAAVWLAWLAYARVPLPPRARIVLATLRAVTLLTLAAILLRPVEVVPAAPAERLVPVLVDVSRSMRLADAAGTPRIERAAAVARAIIDGLGPAFRAELLTFGEGLTSGSVGDLAATARRSDLTAALDALADRYAGRALGGVIVISDGGDTAGVEAAGPRRLAAPIFTIGIGDAEVRDREVLALTAGEAVVGHSTIDLSVSAVSRGFGDLPLDLRVSANGRPIDVRRVPPGADGAPVHEVFTVSPDTDAPTVYTVELTAADGEIASENNARSVLVPPRGRPRRVLLVEGAPGFEHTFLKRALARDAGLQVDSVVRKGQNDQGRDTFFVQAAARRAAALVEGYPARRSDLFVYDALIFGNVEGDFFTRDQLAMTADFVARRGGGLLVLGGRSFERAGLVGTPLEEVLPLDLTDRGGLSRVSAPGPVPPPNVIALTPDGLRHPALRLAPEPAENARRWSALPALAAAAEVGSPRAGAEVLAVTAAPSGGLRPLVATQRYGLGRVMLFAGEASWRWRMLQPASDTTYDTAWRQMVRWLASAAQDPVAIVPLAVPQAGSTDEVGVLVRDEAFSGVTDATVTVRVTGPHGELRTAAASLKDAAAGRYAATLRFDEPGVYRVAAEVTRGGVVVGTASRPVLVGGADLEMSEPGLNEAVLRRVAAAAGGQYVPEGRAEAVPAMLRQAQTDTRTTELRDRWHSGWSLGAILALLAAEWLLRRRAGLA